MASQTKYVGLGGSGCSAVCAGTAFVGASIRLPYLSYECAGAELADTTVYPDLTRFGTVTTPKAQVIKEVGAQFASWDHVVVLSMDPALYRTDGELLMTQFQEEGLSSEYMFAYDTDWDAIVSLVDGLRIQKRRVIFVMGSEAYFRKVICASIVVGANTGITWLSEGAWRDDWYKKSDVLIDSHRAWISEDSKLDDLKLALSDFIRGWNAFAETDEERFEALQPLYATPLLDELLFLEGEEPYHVYHKKWHPVYRKAMLDRNYYDVFMFDLKGNMVYSVFKEMDYATNFGSKKSTNVKFTEWQASGLGDAFRLAIGDPDVVHLTPWSPYGPSAGALASFLSAGVRNENGNVIGVFSTQMPPEALSIENVQPDCSLEEITSRFEGSINFVGLGTPIAADIEKQVPCFKGKTAKAFLELLDQYLVEGYPLGNEANAVLDPHREIRAHSADGACVFAYAVRYLLNDKAHSLYDIEEHTEAVYEDFISYIKTVVNFQGVSGQVKFSSNEKPAYLAVQQVLEGTKVTVGTCSHNASMDFSINGGPSNASWKPAYPDPIPVEPNFPYFIFQIFLPILCICCPALAACIRNF